MKTIFALLLAFTTWSVSVLAQVDPGVQIKKQFIEEYERLENTINNVTGFQNGVYANECLTSSNLEHYKSWDTEAEIAQNTETIQQALIEIAGLTKTTHDEIQSLVGNQSASCVNLDSFKDKLYQINNHAIYYEQPVVLSKKSNKTNKYNCSYGGYYPDHGLNVVEALLAIPLTVIATSGRALSESLKTYPKNDVIVKASEETRKFEITQSDDFECTRTAQDDKLDEEHRRWLRERPITD